MAVEQAYEHFQRLDVVVNNAGYGHFGFVEELTEQDVRAQLETNFFGALWITQAALPYLRRQGSGHLVQVCSIASISAFARVSAYNASKWALEGLSQALALEVAPFGVNVSLIEPGGFATDWAGSSARESVPLEDYDEERAKVRDQRAARMSPPGDPNASSSALLRIVDDPNPPLRVFFGAATLAIAEREYESRLSSWREWQPIAELAQGK